jgi:hypothetical protein
MVKETMKRKRPSFNESYYGFRTFSHLLEDAQRRGIVMLRRDQKSGSYIVEDLGPAARVEGVTAGAAEPQAARAPEAAAPAAEADANGARSGRRRRGRGGRGRRGGVPSAPGALSETGVAADDGEDEEDDADEAASEAPAGTGSAAPSAASGAGERPAFSLFSWLRREGASGEKKP